MSLSSAIQAARSGLQINGLRADNVATNIANATTPGYVRRSVILSETLVGGATTGVQATGIARSQDYALTAQRRALSSDLAQANVVSSAWQSVSARLGDATGTSGLFQTFANFESNLANAVTSPESGTDALAVLSSARAIIHEFKNLADMATNMRSEADREIAGGVRAVNVALEQVEELNSRIAGVDRSSSQAAALFDERQRVLDTIAEYLPIQTIERDSGTIDILSREGVFLLAGTARVIEFDPSIAFGPEQTLASGTLSGLSVDGTALTPGTASYSAISSGLFGALFSLRDQDIPAFNAQLDALADNLVTRMSSDAIDPTKTPGEYGLFVESQPPGTPGLAGRLSLNAALDPEQGGEVWRLRDGLGAGAPGPSGDASILQNLLNAVTAVESVDSNGIQGVFSSSEMVAHFSSMTGQTRLHHETVLSSTVSQHAMLSEAEQAKSGVDIDTQLQDLLLIEQAYAANARVIEAASQMINRLMEI
ncbi:MAG: flagellar hook-associated protein FlgK [Henriciella sp.]|nr:flagellar hook-associated protein FlgK [Henriciella sp.]